MKKVLILLCCIACVGGDEAKDSGSDSDTDSDTDAPAPFTCGEETCDAYTQYCFSFSPGQSQDTAGGGGPTLSCEAIPEACLETRTCECLATAGVSSSGCQVTDGALYVSLDAP